MVVAVSEDQPRVLVVRRRERGARKERPDALPSGPLQFNDRTLESGLRVWVETLTGVRLGYVEQLYTFGDQNRSESGAIDAERALTIGYLALVRAGPAALGYPDWQNWYQYFPWEDRRHGPPEILDRLERSLRRWISAADSRSERAIRKKRVNIAMGLGGTAWSDERVLDRYELLYEVGLVAEAHRDGAAVWAGPNDVPSSAQPMLADHRRILATAIARLRGKIKYRPVVFELMAPTFTLLQLQRTVEALAGVPLHKQNFRRLVEQQGLVEETGSLVTDTGGRPAREVHFREEVALERLAPGVRLPVTRAPD